jgi:hypothetical protein
LGPGRAGIWTPSSHSSPGSQWGWGSWRSAWGVSSSPQLRVWPKNWPMPIHRRLHTRHHPACHIMTPRWPSNARCCARRWPKSYGGRPGPRAAAPLFPPLAQLPRPPLNSLGYTLYPKGYRPQGPRAGRPPAPGRLPHAARARPRPQLRRAPQPQARWLPATSYGAAAPAGMALATVLDSAKASGPSPVGKAGMGAWRPFPPTSVFPHTGRRWEGGRVPISQRPPDRQEGSVCKSRPASRPAGSTPNTTRR